jgi:hypothetical protein
MTKRSAQYKITVHADVAGSLTHKAKQHALDREISPQKLLTEAPEENMKKASRPRNRDGTA